MKRPAIKTLFRFITRHKPSDDGQSPSVKTLEKPLKTVAPRTTLSARKADLPAEPVNQHRSSPVSHRAKRSISKRFSAIQAYFVSVLSRRFPALGKVFAPLMNRNATAESRRRRQHINRRIVIYASTGLVVLAVVLTAVLVSVQAAAPPASSGSPTVSQSQQVAAAPTLTEKPTGSIIATTPPDLIETPSSTPKPATKPTATPTATPKPAVKPTIKPTKTPAPTTKPVDWDELVKYFAVEADTYYDKMGYSSNHYSYTNEELYILAQIIQTESGGELYEGKVAVGNVVMNRVFCDKFGNSITEVVTGGQFAYHSDEEPKPEALRAAKAVLDNEYWVVPQDVYYFNSSKPAGENWGSHTFYAKIGNHCFYTEKYGGRLSGGGVPPALYQRIYHYPQYGCKTEKRVLRIKKMLIKLGYTDLSADKYFGKSTKEAVIAFQKSKGIKADGSAGPATIKALIKAYGTQQYIKDFCS